ncbi:MAG: phage tail assembly protein [Microbispora sp.]|nr:phage tail assembly protein [Microbispora sp.]
MDQTKIIPLDLAIEWNNQTYDELRLREPTWGEVMEARKRGEDSDTFLVSKVSGIPMQAVLKLPGSVMLEAVEAIQAFLAQRRTTGAT